MEGSIAKRRYSTALRRPPKTLSFVERASGREHREKMSLMNKIARNGLISGGVSISRGSTTSKLRDDVVENLGDAVL